ncbi:hypothetical protein FKP32DRAFT_940556 [Trametes sanguinea]|nr:hypothetical protein FKP32DRAFT_940556 [Trametes sanguinea]
MPVRCFQCKAALHGWGTGRQHAQTTGHIWQPGYYCEHCEATFASHSICLAHAKTCPGAQLHSPSTTGPLSACADSESSQHEAADDLASRALLQYNNLPSQDSTSSQQPASATVNYACRFCRLHFVSEQALLEHAKSVSPCGICQICVPHKMMSLQDHFLQSDMHPKCRGCGVAFETLFQWDDHRHKCKAAAPPLVIQSNSTSAPGPKPSTAGFQRSDAKSQKPQAVTISTAIHASPITSMAIEQTPEPDTVLVDASSQSRSIVHEVVSTLCTALSRVGSVTYTIHPQDSPSLTPEMLATTDDSSAGLRSPSPMAMKEILLAAEEPEPLADLKMGSNGDSQAHSQRTASEHDADASPSPGEVAEPDNASLPDRSSLIAQAALDLVAQHYGTQAADRVARVIQSLAAEHVEDEGSRAQGLDGGGRTHGDHEGSACSTGRSVCSDVGIASPCSPACAVPPPDVYSETNSDKSEAADPSDAMSSPRRILASPFSRPSYSRTNTTSSVRSQRLPPSPSQASEPKLINNTIRDRRLDEHRAPSSIRLTSSPAAPVSSKADHAASVSEATRPACVIHAWYQ